MQPLEKQFIYQTRIYTQLKRTKKVAIYEVAAGSPYWEVFIIKTSPAVKFPPSQSYPEGRSYPEREVYPTDEDFGITAWCFSGKIAAEKRFEEKS